MESNYSLESAEGPSTKLQYILVYYIYYTYIYLYIYMYVFIFMFIFIHLSLLHVLATELILK
jgi:hypothetical protein